MIDSRRKLLLTERDVSMSFGDHKLVLSEIVARNNTGAREAMFSHLDRVYLIGKRPND